MKVEAMGVDHTPTGPTLAIALPDGAIGLGLSSAHGSESCEALVINEVPGQPARDRVLPSVNELLTRANCDKSDIQAIIFESGPSGFSRVRAACALAQGLAYGLNVAIGGLDSLGLRALALSQQAPATQIVVIRVARDAEFYCAAYSGAGGHIEALSPPRLCPAESVAPWLGSLPPRLPGQELLFVGDGAGAFAPDRRDDPTLIRDIIEPDAVALIHTLATKAHRYVQWGDAASAQPLYLRDKVALDVAEQAQLRASRKVVSPS